MENGVPSPKVERPDHVSPDRVVDFDMYNPPNVAEDFFAAWKTLHEPGVADVVWTPYNGGHWIPTRSNVVKDVFSDYERFSSRVILVPKEVGETLSIIPVQVDPPRHRPYRKLLNDALGPKVVRQLEGKVRDIAIELIESFRERGHCEFTTEFAEVYPIRIFMGLAELPVADLPEVKGYVDAIIHPTPDLDQASAFQAVQNYMRPYIEARMGGDGTDLLSNLINQTVDGRSISPDEGLAMGVQVLIAGVDTVLNFVSFVMLFMASNPSYREQLIADPELIGPAVEELFRRFPIVTMAREIREDTVFDGALLKKGEMIIAPSMLAGLDDRVNKCPMDVDFRRTAIDHATFGYGHHFCPGSHLARKEVRIMLEEWLARIPDFQVAEGTQIRFLGGGGGSVTALPLTWPSQGKG